MSLNFVYTTVAVILLCGGCLAQNPTPMRNCSSMPALTIKPELLEGAWWEIERSGVQGSFDYQSHCVQMNFALDNTTKKDGNFSVSLYKDHKKSTLGGRFTVLGGNMLLLTYNGGNITTKMVDALDNVAALCGQVNSGQYGSWILSKKLQLSQQEFNFTTKVKNTIEEFSKGEVIEQDLKKCSSAASFVPVLSLILASLLLLFKN